MGLDDWNIEICIRNKKDTTQWSKLTSNGENLPPEKVLIPSMLIELERIIAEHESKYATK